MGIGKSNGRSWRNAESLDDIPENYTLIQTGFIDENGVWRKASGEGYVEVEKYFNKDNEGNEIVYKSIDRFYDWSILVQTESSNQGSYVKLGGGGGGSSFYNLHYTDLNWGNRSQTFPGGIKTLKFTWFASDIAGNVTYTNFYANELGNARLEVRNQSYNGTYVLWNTGWSTPQGLGIYWNINGQITINNIVPTGTPGAANSVTVVTEVI